MKKQESRSKTWYILKQSTPHIQYTGAETMATAKHRSCMQNNLVFQQDAHFFQTLFLNNRLIVY